MAQTRTLVLGCVGNTVLLDILRQHVEELLVVRGESLPERTCVQVGAESVPLCQADVLSATGRMDLRALYERLARLVELRGRKHLSPSSNRLVRELLTSSSSALSACTALMRMLNDTGFREGDRDLDQDARHQVEALSGLLDGVAASYDMTPLLLMAVLVEGGLSGVVAAMLQGRDIAELSRRGSLFFTVMVLIRNASKLPDVAQLLASTTRHQGHSVSVLGLLSTLATSARVLLHWDVPTGASRAAAAAIAAADLQERQRKMANRILETYGTLHAMVESFSGWSVAAASAAAAPPAAADRLARIAQELRVPQGTPAEAPPSLYDMPAGRQPTGSMSTSGLGGGHGGGSGRGGGSHHHASISYDGRDAHQHQHSTSATAGDRSTSASDRRGPYTDDVYGGSTYGAAPASATAAAESLYRNGGSGAGPPVEDLYGISVGGVGSAAGHAAQHAIESLRTQRELYRLQRAASELGAIASGPYVRYDGLSHQSQAEGLTSPYDPTVTSSLSYPWQQQQQQQAAAESAAAVAVQGTLYPWQQQTQQQQTTQQQQGSYTMYEAVPVATTFAVDGGASQQQLRVHQRAYDSVPTTPQRQSAAAAAVAQYAPQPHQQQQAQQQQMLQQQQLQQQMLVQQQQHEQHQQGQWQQQQQLEQELVALSERLKQMSGGGGGAAAASTTAAAAQPAATSYDLQSYGRHLSGYGVGGAVAPLSGNHLGTQITAAAAATAIADRQRSAARQRMPSADAAFSNTLSTGGGGGGGGGGVAGGGGGVLLSGAGGGLGYPQQAPLQAWAAEAAPWQQQPGGHQPARQQPQQQLQPQQQQQPPAVRAASSASGPPVREPWMYQEDAAGTAGAAARPGSAYRMRALGPEGAAVGVAAAPPVWSPTGDSGGGSGGGGGGRVAMAWSAVAAEAVRSQPQQLSRTMAAASVTTTAGGSRAASTSRGTTHGSRSHRAASTRSPDGSSSGGGGSSGVDLTSRRGGSTLRALAADSGLIPGLSKSPRGQHQQHDHHHQQHEHRHSPYQQQEPPAHRPQSAPRTGAVQRASAQQATAAAAASGSHRDRQRTVERRAAASDPWVGPAPAVRSAGSTGGGAAATSPRGGAAGLASPASLLYRYSSGYMPMTQSALTASATAPVASAGGAPAIGIDASYHASSPAPAPSAAGVGSRSPRYGSGGTSASPASGGGSSSSSAAAAQAAAADVAAFTTATPSTTRAAAAGPVSPPGSTRQHHHSGWDASTTTTAAASSGHWDPARGSSGGGAAAAAQQYSLPYRRAGDGPGAAASAPARQPALQLAAWQPASVPSSVSMSSGGVRPSGAGGAYGALGRPADADGLRSAGGALAAPAAGARGGRRRMTATRQSDDSSNDDDDQDLQIALQMSRLEAEAAAAAEKVMASTAAAAAAANAAAAGPVRSPPAAAAAGVRTTHGSPSRSAGGDRRAPSPQQRALALVPSGTIDEGGGGGNLVGAAVPMAALHQRYAVVNPLLSVKLVSLEDDFPRTRRVAGDGNCFYRAALFALMEHVLAAPDGVLCEQLETVVENYLRRLESVLQQQQQQQQQDAPQATGGGSSGGGSGAAVSGGRSRAATPERLRGGGIAPVTPAAAAAGVDAGDPAAVRGGRRLLRLLRTAWFKEVDAAEPSDVSSLERLFNHSTHSGEVIRFARRLTVHELQSDEDFYAPFIPGCGGDYSGMGLHQIFVQHVLPMGVEVEQLQIIAMCRALGATVAVLDVAGSQVGAIKHGPAGHLGPPVAWVAHLPGHYDVVYPAKPLDVAPGGALVPVEEQ